MQPVISIRDLKKHYRDCKALDGVTFDVPPGVVFALLGENGAGKTTLIRTLTGFVRPDSGTAAVLGKDCTEHSIEIRRKIGYVSDAPALYDWMRPDEIGWFTAAFYPEGFLQRFHEWIAHFEVPSGRKIRQLSKGQRAKVALALAIAHEPELLILDEPTSGLDPVVRRQFLESMVDRAATGRTVLLSSHQISEVERVADWIAILHEGRLRILQPLTELKESVADITVTLADAMVEIPLPAGEVLSQSRSGRHLHMIVRDFSDADAAAIRGAAGVVSIERRQPTLEDIFVACTHGTPPVVESPVPHSRQAV